MEEDQKTISVLNGDPLFNGIAKNGQLIGLEDVKILAPVLPRSKVVCVGKNYSEHAKEMGGEVPAEPKPEPFAPAPPPPPVERYLLWSLTASVHKYEFPPLVAPVPPKPQYRVGDRAKLNPEPPPQIGRAHV